MCPTTNNNNDNNNDNNNNSSSSSEETIVWKVGDPVPDELGGATSSLSSSVLLSTLVPRPTAWISVNDTEVALLNGYTAASYTPPTIVFAATALPSNMIRQLRETKRCSVSAATVREPMDSFVKASFCTDDKKRCFSFQQLGLQASSLKQDYPPTIETSPIRMHCSLEHCIDFDDDAGADNDDAEAMIVLIVENFVIDGSVLSPPTESMKQRDITAKIDAQLIQPMVCMGGHQFEPMVQLKSMPRPQYNQETQEWTSTELEAMDESSTMTSTDVPKYDTIEWNFRTEGRNCPLGFNPTTALIMPRPIGWISTYTKTDKPLCHLAPYSFFIDVAQGNKSPKVAFSAFRKEDTIKKDAHKNAEESGSFCFNMVNQELAVAMNYSAAELPREESEFELSKLKAVPAKYVNAPIVEDAKIQYECDYLQTIDVDSFSIVIGQVKAVSVKKSILSQSAAIAADNKTTGIIDTEKLGPLMRLGYMDEYGVF